MSALLFSVLILSTGYPHLFSDHSVINRFGVLSFVSWRNLTSYEPYLALSFFGEAEFLKMFGLRLDFPFGYDLKKSILKFSDFSADLKFNPVDLVLSPTFILSFEFPTGSTPFSQRRIIISPQAYFKFDVAFLKLDFILGANFSPEKKEEVNLLYPHTTKNEVFLFSGYFFDVAPKILSAGIRIGGIYEDFSRFVFQPSAHLVLSVLFLDFDVFAVGNFGQNGNVRQGYELGGFLSFKF